MYGFCVFELAYVAQNAVMPPDPDSLTGSECQQIHGSTYLVLVGTETEVLHSLTGILWTTEEESVGTSGGAHGEFVEGEALAASLQNASTGGAGKSESSDAHLGNLEEAVVVSDGADNNDRLVLVLGGSVLVGGARRDAGERHWRLVDARHIETSEDDLVEARVRTACRFS